MNNFRYLFQDNNHSNIISINIWSNHFLRTETTLFALAAKLMKFSIWGPELEYEKSRTITYYFIPQLL